MFLHIFLLLVVSNQILVHGAFRDNLSFTESNFITRDLSVIEIEIIHLIQKCSLRNDRTVALIGDLPQNVIKKLHDMEITATASIGNRRSKAEGSALLYEQVLYSKSAHRKSFWIGWQRIIHDFVVAAPSQPLLRTLLEKARASVWWYSQALFIVTSASDDDDDNDNCRNAFAYLWTLWQMGILNSVFLCKDFNGILATYSFSPYNDHHLESWRKVHVHAGRGQHPWTLLKLKQVQVSDEHLCDVINFDKVKKLNGYPILIGVLTIPPTLIVNETGKSWSDKHFGEDAAIVSLIWSSINGTMRLKYYKGKDPIGFGRENGTYTGFMADVSSGEVDHGMNGMFVDIQWRIRSAYPHALSGVHFLTPSRGNIPNWVKIVTIYDFPVTVGILATIFTGIVFIRHVDHRSWSISVLDVTRVTLSLSMSRWPRRLPSRIFWSLAFFTIPVTTSCFQGLLISILTKPTPYRNIDEVEDLIASGYDIDGYIAFKEFFKDSKFSGKFHPNNINTSCFEDVGQGKPVACVSDYMYLRDMTISKDRVHMSKGSVSTFYTGFVTKIDWPLFNRFNILVQRLVNAGITGYLREFYYDEMVRRHWSEMRSTLQPDLKVLSLIDLAFIFHVLIAGLLFSMFIFFGERILGRNRT